MVNLYERYYNFIKISQGFLYSSEINHYVPEQSQQHTNLLTQKGYKRMNEMFQLHKDPCHQVREEVLTQIYCK